MEGVRVCGGKDFWKRQIIAPTYAEDTQSVCMKVYRHVIV